jgi:hypothetical protein
LSFLSLFPYIFNKFINLSKLLCSSVGNHFFQTLTLAKMASGLKQVLTKMK